MNIILRHEQNAKKIQVHDKAKRQNNNYEYNADKKILTVNETHQQQTCRNVKSESIGNYSTIIFNF